MFPANASSLEITWSAVAGLGLVAGLVLLAYIWLSWRAVGAWIRERRIVALGPRHRFVLGFLMGVMVLNLVWVGFIALGVNAMLNPPPFEPVRVEASERGGWILVALESLLLMFQVILTLAWTSLGRPSITPDTGSRAPVALLFRAIDLGREMGHTVANDVQPAVAILDEIAQDETASPALRSHAAIALNMLQNAVDRVQALHATIRALEDTP